MGTQDVYNGGLYFFHHPFRLVVVHFAGCPDKPCFLGRRVHNEPGVYGDAVSAHAAAWLQDVDARVAIGKADEFPNIDVQLIADHGQFICESDVHVAEAVFRQLAHFRRTGVGYGKRAFDEKAVDLCGHFRGLCAHAADSAVVIHKFMENLAGQDSFRTIGHLYIRAIACLLRKSKVGPCLGKPIRHAFRRPYRRCGF